MFEIQPMDPATFRQQTRRSTVIIAVLFLLLAMLFSSVAVAVFGEPDGDNLRFNVGGVFVAFLLTAALLRGRFWHQTWMAPAVYGWRLKRNLMSITNVMHQVTAAVQSDDPTAMKVLRFYHLGLLQMHELDVPQPRQAAARAGDHRHVRDRAGEDGRSEAQPLLEARGCEYADKGKVHDQLLKVTRDETDGDRPRKRRIQDDPHLWVVDGQVA